MRDRLTLIGTEPKKSLKGYRKMPKLPKKTSKWSIKNLTRIFNMIGDSNNLSSQSKKIKRLYLFMKKVPIL